jgi:hypothetical protein
VRRLPRPAHDFADASHRLAIARHHADRAKIVQHILGGDRLATDAAFGKRDVLGDVLVEVMAHHQHVEVLIECVDGEGTVGLVELGSTFGSPHTLMMSGAWPPPAPSVW